MHRFVLQCLLEPVSYILTRENADTTKDNPSAEMLGVELVADDKASEVLQPSEGPLNVPPSLVAA